MGATEAAAPTAAAAAAKKSGRRGGGCNVAAEAAVRVWTYFTVGDAAGKQDSGGGQVTRASESKWGRRWERVAGNRLRRQRRQAGDSPTPSPQTGLPSGRRQSSPTPRTASPSLHRAHNRKNDTAAVAATANAIVAAAAAAAADISRPARAAPAPRATLEAASGGAQKREARVGQSFARHSHSAGRGRGLEPADSGVGGAQPAAVPSRRPRRCRRRQGGTSRPDTAAAQGGIKGHPVSDRHTVRRRRHHRRRDRRGRCRPGCQNRRHGCQRVPTGRRDRRRGRRSSAGSRGARRRPGGGGT